MPDRYSSISIDSNSRPQKSKSTKPRRRRESLFKKITGKIPRNPYLITLFVIVFLFALYCLLGFFLVPVLIEKTFPERLAKQTRMEATIGGAQFNPFTFHLHLKDIAVYNTNGSMRTTPFAKASELDATLAPLPLFQKKLVCLSLHIARPDVVIIHYPDNAYNISNLFGNPEGETQGRRFEFPKLPFLFSFSNFSISNGSLVFDDRTRGNEHKVDKIQLTLPTFSNFFYKSKSSVSPSFSAVINGSPIQLTGEASMAGGIGAGQTRLSFDLHSLNLPLYFNYLPFSFPVQLTKGKADGQIQVSFVPKKDHSQRLTILFQLDTKDSELSAKDGSLTMSIPTAKLEGDFQPFTGNLHFQNILFHEPKIRLNSTFSEKTLDTLLPSSGKNLPESRSQRSVPHFSSDLFIMDNGFLQITAGKKRKEKTYRSLQLSIKNYNLQSSEKTLGGRTCRFTLSGEQLSPPASFSWKGTVDKNNIARGTLQLNRFPASLLGSIFIRNKDTRMTGTTDMTGTLSLQRTPGGQVPFSYTISKGSVKFSDLLLSDRKVPWLHADSFTLGSLETKGKVLDIGNITAHGATMTLRKGHLPHLLSSIAESESLYKIHGLDFSGRIELLAHASSGPHLIFNDITMQGNHLEDAAKDQENFAAAARIDQSGSIKAKGTVSLTPFHAALSVQFSGMPMAELLPWYTNSAFLLNGRGVMDGIGQLSYPEYSYKGRLTISNALFDNKGTKSELSWKTAVLQSLDYQKRPFHLNLDSATVSQPAITYSQPDDRSNILLQTSSFIKNLLPKPKNPKQSKESNSSEFFIKTISLQEGKIIYNDLRLTPPWQQQIQNFSGEIQNISRSSENTTADYVFSGTLAGNPISIQGSITPFGEKLTAMSSLKLTQIPISILKDQLSPLFPLDTSKGSFDLTLEDSFHEGKETGEAKYIFHGLSPKSSTSDIALPLALLADGKDNFMLTLPLTDSDEKKIEPVFVDTTQYFKRLIVKSMISPLLLTNQNFSQLAVDDTPDFLPGESMLSDKGKAKLALYRDLLSAHPRLTLAINGLTDNDSDRKALKKDLTQAEKRRVKKENERRAEQWEIQQNKNQKSQPDQQKSIVEKDIPADQLAKYAPILEKQITVTNQDMENLARQRTTVAYAYLTQELGLSPKRVAKQDKPSKEPAAQANRIQISLIPLTAPAQSQEESSVSAQ